MKKIVHVIEALSGGAPITISYIIQYQLQYQHIIVYSTRNELIDNDKIFEQFPVGTQFIRWPYVQREISLSKDWKALVSLYQLLKKIGRIDVLHYHSSKAGVLGRLVGMFVPVGQQVYTAHGASFNRQDVSGFKRLFFGALEWIMSLTKCWVVAVSESEARTFKNFGIRARVICNGVAPQKPLLSMTVPGERRGEIVVGTSGRIAFQKNPVAFNQIAASLQSDSRFRFIWIGEGERSTLTAANISITGWLTREEVAEQVAQLDIYLSTSLWEGLPFSVIEAMQFGRPLLVSSCVGNRDLIFESPKNGFVYESVEQGAALLIQMGNQAGLLREMGTASELLFERNFTAERMAQQYHALYFES